jgi:hypothetical protein
MVSSNGFEQLTRFDFISNDVSDRWYFSISSQSMSMPHVLANTKLLKTSSRKKSRLTVYFDWQTLQSLFRLKNVKKSISINLIKTPSDTECLQQENNCRISKKVQFQPTVVLNWNSLPLKLWSCLQFLSDLIQWKPLYIIT